MFIKGKYFFKVYVYTCHDMYIYAYTYVYLT